MQQQPRHHIFALGLSLLAICTIGSAVEFCWAAGEAVLVPYLTKHGVEQWVVSTIYLANPTLGLFVQPRLGAWSDRINRRVPFVVALSMIALVGISTLLSAIPLTQALGIIVTNDDSSNVIPAMAIVMAFVGFGAADICFDCLLIPGRALLDDMTVQAGRSDEANALFTGFQLGGRLLALLLCSSSWTTFGLWGFYKGVDAHFDACFTISAIFLMGSMFLVVFLVDDRGSTYDAITNGFKNGSIESGEMDVEVQKYLICHDNDCDVQQTITQTQTLSSCSDSKSQTDNTQQSCIGKVDASVLLFAVQAVGWVGICAQSFFWTSWRGEQVGCIDLALQGVVGMATAGFLPFVNAYFGAASVWCGSELLFHLLMMSVYLLPSSDGNVPRIISALTGINYAVHATNGLIVATDLIPDPNKRARTIAMVNNALPMGQLITALSGGAIAQYFGGYEYAFIFYGFLGAIVTSAVWVTSSRQKMFFRR